MITKLVIVIVLFLSSTSAFSATPISYFSVGVHDEAGKSIEGAVVKGGFSNLKYNQSCISTALGGGLDNGSAVVLKIYA